MAQSVILGAARTPFARLLGALSSKTAVELGAVASRAALERAGVAPAELGYAVLGTVVQAGQGHIPSRQVTQAIGVPDAVGSDTINKVCASGLRAIALADLLVRAGEHELVLAGGMESMSQAPYLALGARQGFRFGDVQLVDANQQDALRDPWRGRLMYDQADEVARELGLGREDQDAWAARSQARALAAAAGRAREIAGVEIAGRKGAVAIVAEDEGPRETSAEALAALRPLVPGGTVTAGNAPGVNDGAAAVVVASAAAAAARGAEVRARILATGATADETRRLALAPAEAARIALGRAGLGVGDVARFEINEAFASVALNAARSLGADEARVNVDGGAIALGHPVGASGARLIVTLIRQLEDIGGGIGVAAICSGGGQGDAMVIEVPAR